MAQVPNDSYFLMKAYFQLSFFFFFFNLYIMSGQRVA